MNNLHLGKSYVRQKNSFHTINKTLVKYRIIYTTYLTNIHRIDIQTPNVQTKLYSWQSVSIYQSTKYIKLTNLNEKYFKPNKI